MKNLPASDTIPAFFELDSSWGAAQARLKTFICPTAGDITGSDGTPAYYAGNGGSGGSQAISMWYWPDQNYPLGKTNYTGVWGSNGHRAATVATSPYVDASGNGVNLRKYAGIFQNRKGTGITAINDGASNTLMFGEGLGGTNASGQETFTWRWVNVHPMPTRHGLKPDHRNNSWAQFGSKHTGIVQFSMGDGSVRGVRPAGTSVSAGPVTADWFVYQAMAGMNDGDVFDGDQISR